MSNFSYLKNKLLIKQVENRISYCIQSTSTNLESKLSNKFEPGEKIGVARMAPKRVVYVSCNPETMARDLALLTAKGYRAEGFTPVDLFPQTAHCEVVGSLVKADYWKLE